MRRLQIATVKPDYGIVGGFERVLERIANHLRSGGHTVEARDVPVASLGRAPFGVPIPPPVWDAAPDFFRYASLVERFTQLDLAPFDLVVSTQPPSFAVRHPRQLSIFYHHVRMFYDLSDEMVDSGQVRDAELHRAAAERVRRIDARFIGTPRVILAGSHTVKGRLKLFHGLDDNVEVFHAGVGVPAGTDGEAPGGVGALCVSRHEFPKRTELFVAALKLVPHLAGTVVGGGGRLPFVRALDERLSRAGEAERVADDVRLWLTPHTGAETFDEAAASNVRFLGHVEDGTLASLYRGALCVVAPAYQEDYGLTAIEAMHHGLPVIVCRDGGGLTELVEDGVNGLVVEPTPRALAAAIAQMCGDADLRESMGTAARTHAREFTWERAGREIDLAVERVLA